MGAKRQPPHAAGAPARTSGPLAGLPRQRAELGYGSEAGFAGVTVIIPQGVAGGT